MENYKKRLSGALPKIGIRPIIDGRRRGIRESLENQTMAMAQAAAQLISQNLRHSNGLPVECVIADTTIGGVAEAARCADKFAKEGVGVSISVTPCWCYGMETIDMDPLIPKAIWGFNGTEDQGRYIYLLLLLAMTRLDYLLLVSMVKMSRIRMIKLFPKMSNKNCYNLPKLGWPLPR